MKKLILIVLLLAGLSGLTASQLVEISPVRDTIVLLYFDDGYVEHYGLGGDGNQDKVVRKILPTNLAMNPESYAISSSDDENYSSPQHPETVGRKSKGKDFTSNWGQGLPYVSEHFVYLVLPTALKRAHTYQFQLNSRLAENGDTFTFRFEVPLVRSETIHVNQIGYAPVAPVKLAYLSHWMGDLGPLDLSDYEGERFQLFNLADSSFAYEGTVELRKDLETDGPDCAYDEHAPYGSFVGADVYVCDFSDFIQPGEYVLVVNRLGTSYPFRVHEDAYREAFYATIRALYHNRCGIALESEYTDYTRGRCHHPAETDSVILSDWTYLQGGNPDAFEQLPATATDEKRGYWGGWHDAADWDKHHFHLSGARQLLTAYELFPENFSDDELNIPESGNGIPDIIDEARWCIDFYKRMQEPDGSVHGGIETWRHPAGGTSCVLDTDQWYVFAPDAISGLHYAASAAQLAFCLEIAGDISQKQEYLKSAKQAFDWAMNHTDEAQWQEQEFRDMRQLASAWLFKATGETIYQDYFKTDNKITGTTTDLEVWQSHDQQWAVYAYVTTEQPTIDSSLKSRLEQAVEHWAYSDHINNADRRGYQYGNDWWLPIAWGHATRPRIFPPLMAYVVSGDEKYLGYLSTTADYILGANPLNMCWVTGIGEKSPQEVMHLDSWYYNTDIAPVPGIIPFGPISYSDKNPQGPWQPEWGMKTTYPHASEWPSHELYFDNRYCPPQNEFTVHNSIAPAAAAFGVLTAKGGKFTEVAGRKELMPASSFAMAPNYPNPFNGQTTIDFHLEESRDIELAVYNMQGQKVRQLVSGRVQNGSHRFTWDGRSESGVEVASGLYIIRLQVQNRQTSQKVMLLR